MASRSNELPVVPGEYEAYRRLYMSPEDDEEES